MTLRWDANLKRIAPKAASSRHPGLPLAQVLKQARRNRQRERHATVWRSAGVHMFAVVAGYGSMRCIDSSKCPQHRKASKQMDMAHDLVRRGLERDPTSCECWFQLLPGYVVGGECRALRQWAGRSKYGLQRLLASFSRAAEDEYEQELRVFQSSGVVLDTAPDGLGYSITEVLASRSAGNGTLEEKDDPCFKGKWPLLPRKQARSSFPTSTIPTGHAYCGMRVKDRPAGQNVAQPSNRTASRNVQSPQSLAWDRSSRGWPKDTAAAPVATRLKEVIGRALFWELERSDDVSRSSPQVLNG
ncbi:hypothetical protein CPAR01_04185 [Colletotrichum paranaense]|uniref:Uncharacterized protein n=1 Tax=Colletotrichum paranaense TaxID=1914294 RepID=A0ABQ9SVM0_9PEZI|nr:uncharacterized protein CPAR01_04185 [Colletotrichum paranaense]KAK1543552.1 hypothetical protein CPAR01_04185 [Colletotrichum paranaense]